MKRSSYLVWSLLLLLVPGAAQGALIFNLSHPGSTPQQAVDGFTAGAARWSSIFDDNITVNIDVDFAALGAGILAQAGSTDSLFSYSSVRGALIADKTSADDNTATANLPGGSSFGMLLNRTSNSPNGSGSATPFVDNDGDANNSNIRMSTANAKALGLLSPHAAGIDASITFSSNFSFDFDPSDGITAGQFDFVGIAAHEIGHVMGFFSGVDILDINSPPVNGPFPDHLFTYVNTLDLYRYSILSEASGVIDWTADTRAKFFSLDGGATFGPSYSTGTNFGDGRQASHWKDNLGLGTMDPTAATGELLAISPNDIRAFDVIGYNLHSEAVPEPATLVIWGFGALGCAVVRFRRKPLNINSSRSSI